MEHQNLTIRLAQETVRKAKVLAARRGVSLSMLVSSQIEHLANQEDAYERAHREALRLMERPLPIGGTIVREQLHER